MNWDLFSREIRLLGSNHLCGPSSTARGPWEIILSSGHLAEAQLPGTWARFFWSLFTDLRRRWSAFLNLILYPPACPGWARWIFWIAFTSSFTETVRSSNSHGTHFIIKVITPAGNHLSESSTSRYMPSHRRTSIHQLPLHLPVVEVLPQWAFPSPSSPSLPRRGVPHPLPVLCQPPSNCLTPHLNPFHLLPWRFNKGNDTCLPQAIPLSQQRVLWSCKSHCKLPTYLSDFVSLFVSVFLCSSQLVLDKGDRIRPAQPWISASMANLE